MFLINVIHGHDKKKIKAEAKENEKAPYPHPFFSSVYCEHVPCTFKGMGGFISASLESHVGPGAELTKTSPDDCMDAACPLKLRAEMATINLKMIPLYVLDK